jgi:hypothetical protein
LGLKPDLRFHQQDFEALAKELRARPHGTSGLKPLAQGLHEAFWRQTTENFIRGLENALRHFGGVVNTLVIDNLRAAVQKADWFEPKFNPKVVSFCEHYGTVILPTKPAMPRHKGKVEAGVDYVQENALAGKHFESLAAQNLHLAQHSGRHAHSWHDPPWTAKDTALGFGSLEGPVYPAAASQTHPGAFRRLIDSWRIGNMDLAYELGRP